MRTKKIEININEIDNIYIYIKFYTIKKKRHWRLQYVYIKKKQLNSYFFDVKINSGNQHRGGYQQRNNYNNNNNFNNNNDSNSGKLFTIFIFNLYEKLKKKIIFIYIYISNMIEIWISKSKMYLMNIELEKTIYWNFPSLKKNKTLYIKLNF